MKKDTLFILTGFLIVLVILIYIDKSRVLSPLEKCENECDIGVIDIGLNNLCKEQACKGLK